MEKTEETPKEMREASLAFIAARDHGVGLEDRLIKALESEEAEAEALRVQTVALRATASWCPRGADPGRRVAPPTPCGRSAETCPGGPGSRGESGSAGR